MKYLILFLVFADVSAISANRYCVTNGNDSASGLSGAPWKTVGLSMTKLTNGETLSVAAGVYNDGVNGQSYTITGNNLNIIGTNATIQIVASTTANAGQVSNWRIYGTNNVIKSGVSGQFGFGFTTAITGSSGARSYGFNGGVVELDGTNCIMSDFIITNISAKLLSGNGGDLVWLLNMNNSAGMYNAYSNYVVSNIFDCDIHRIWGISNTMENFEVGWCFNTNYDYSGSRQLHADFYQIFGSSSTAKWITFQNGYVHDCAPNDGKMQLGNTETSGNLGQNGSLNMREIHFLNMLIVNYPGTYFNGVPATRWYNCVFDNVGKFPHNVSIWYYEEDDVAGGNIYWSTNAAVDNCVFYNSAPIAINNLTPRNYTLTSADISQLGVYSGSTPGFVNEPGRDYHITSLSVLRGLGVNRSTYFTNDKDGLSRPALGAWDSGAYVFANAIAPPPSGLVVVPSQTVYPMTFHSP